MKEYERSTIANVRYAGEDAAADAVKHLEAVLQNPNDFEKWEALVILASNLEGGVTRNSSPSSIDLVRGVFDHYLAKFPLLFGYWKRYADLEFSIGGTESAEMVYERGVSCVSTSVDLWQNYCAFKMQTSHDNNVIRDLFERGAGFVGPDFQSHPFWDKYIEFEDSVREPSNVTKILRRIIQLPIYQYTRYFEKFGLLIATEPMEELVDPEILEGLTRTVHMENEGGPDKSPLEVERQIRAKIHEYYVNAYAQVALAVNSRWNYEQAIKRSYFTVAEVDAAEIDNWHKYLDFEEEQGDFERTSFLYERCLVACALYPEFWLRFARWMLSKGKEENTRIIYEKASTIFVPISATGVRLAYARFEEKHGRYLVSRDIYLSMLMTLPEHTETIIALAGLERRHRGNDAAVDLLENYITGLENHQVAAQLAVEQARILWQCKGSVDEARKVFQSKAVKFSDSHELWTAYLEFEINLPSTGQDEAHSRVKGVYDMLATGRSFSEEAFKELSRIYMAFLLDRGTKDAAEEYMQLDMKVYGPKHVKDTVMADVTLPIHASAAKVQRY